jgi:hypothetical protein
LRKSGGESGGLGTGAEACSYGVYYSYRYDYCEYLPIPGAIVVKPQLLERNTTIWTVVLLNLWRRCGGQEHSDGDDEDDDVGSNGCVDEGNWLNLRHYG